MSELDRLKAEAVQFLAEFVHPALRVDVSAGRDYLKIGQYLVVRNGSRFSPGWIVTRPESFGSLGGPWPEPARAAFDALYMAVGERLLTLWEGRQAPGPSSGTGTDIVVSGGPI